MKLPRLFKIKDIGTLSRKHNGSLNGSSAMGLTRDLIRGVYKLEGRLLLDLSTNTVLSMDRWQSAGEAR